MNKFVYGRITPTLKVVGSNPVGRTKSEQALYRLLRLFNVRTHSRCFSSSFCRLSSLSLSGSRENFSLTFLLVLGILVLGDDAVALLGVASGILSSKDSESPFLYPFSPINAVKMNSVFFFSKQQFASHCMTCVLLGLSAFFHLHIPINVL